MVSSIDKTSALYRYWLLIIGSVFIYNFFSITLRASFQQYQQGNMLIGWLITDYTCDIILIIDIIYVKPRISLFERGLQITDMKVLRKAYFSSRTFKLDLLCVLPLDFLYLAVGYVQPLFRLNRLIGVRYYMEAFDRFQRSSQYPELVRMFKTVIYILMTVHLYTCAYFIFSASVGIGGNQFVFEGGEWPAYSRCFYLTFKMATRIGMGPEKEPTTTAERALMAMFWLIALFVEIFLLAQIREVFISMTKEDDEFMLLLSTVLQYIRRYKCPREIEKKVIDWFTQTRETQRTLDEDDILHLLPNHLQAELAFDINYKLLSKVSIFSKCHRSIICDVVLKLKLEMFFPGDIIYKRGDVGKNMFIIQRGQIEVLTNDDKVMAHLNEGAVFGEASLLAIGTNERRQVTVRSKGYSNLFVLSKEDFQETVLHHPKLYKRVVKLAASNKEATEASANAAALFNKSEAILEAIQKEQEEQENNDDKASSVHTDASSRASTPKLLRFMFKLLPSRFSTVSRMKKGIFLLTTFKIYQRSKVRRSPMPIQLHPPPPKVSNIHYSFLPFSHCFSPSQSNK